MKIVFALFLIVPAYGQAWVVKPPSPLATYYVSTAGTGDGTTRNTPMPLSTALSASIAGDWYWLKGGDYGSGIDITRSGTEANPIVYRVLPGERAKIDYIECSAAEIYLWGWELEWDPTLSLQTQSGIYPTSGCVGMKVINVISHDIPANCYFVGDTGARQIYYGNIGWDCDPTGAGNLGFAHCIYGQNTHADNGIVYLVSNFCVDQANQDGDDPFNLHLFRSGASQVQGFHIENNIFINGKNTAGGDAGTQEHTNVIKENWIRSGAQFVTRSTPSTWQFTNNYVAGGFGFQVNQGWCQDTGNGANPTKPQENTVTGNSFINNGTLKAFQWECACYNSGVEATQRQVNGGGNCDLDAGDTWNNNTYHTTASVVDVEYSFSAEPNGKLGAIDVSGGWKDDTGYDADSTITVSGGTPADFSVVDPNEYEEMSRCHVFAANWDLSANESIDLSTCLSVGFRYHVYRLNDTGRSIDPVTSGTYAGGSVNLPTGGKVAVGWLVARDYNFGGGTVAVKRLGRRGR